MIRVQYSAKFKQDLKRIYKRGYDLKLMEKVITLLATGNPLPPKYREHPLKGKYIAHMECHITPDWLLVYKLDQEILLLTMTRTGSHSDLF